jgi:stress response protein YsnF
MSKKTVIGVFDDAAQADAAIRDLESHDFSRGECRVLSNTGMGTMGGAGTALDLRPDLEEKGVPSADATYFMQSFRDGKTLVEVSVDDWDRAENAANILVDHGAQGPIREVAGERERAAGTAEYPVAGAERMEHLEEGERETRIPVIEEELKVGTRKVESGRTRIYSRVVEQPVSQQVNLREERTIVERRPADRPATEAELREAEGKVVEVRGTKEEPVIEKEPRVVEEVVIKEEAREHPEEIKGTVRRTEVHVEKEGEKEEKEGLK